MVANIIKFLLSNFTLTFFVIGVICSLISIYRHRSNATKAFVVEAFFRYYCLWALGITSIYNAVMHIVFHKMAAGFIGWADSPFQLEVGVASLGMGIVGVICFKKYFGMRLALVIMSSVFLWGAAGGHFYQIAQTHNYAPGNTGIMLWSDLITPILSITLLLMSYASTKKEDKFHPPLN